MLRIYLIAGYVAWVSLSAQVTPEFDSPQDSVAMWDTVDARSNAYIHEDWAYFAERLRNEFLALGERKYRRREYQAAVLEYHSFILHFPDDGLVPLVHYRMGVAYHGMGEPDLARVQYEAARAHPAAGARVRVVSIRQLARLDYDRGAYAEVLASPLDNDPYVLVLKGFAALTPGNWPTAEGYFARAKRFYPRKGQAIISGIIVQIRDLANIKYYSAWGGRIWNLAPGGGLARMGLWGEAMGFGIGVGTLALGAAVVNNWTRVVMAAGAAGLYWASYGAAARQREAANLGRLQLRLEAIRGKTNVATLWSFAHPAIF